MRLLNPQWVVNFYFLSFLLIREIFSLTHFDSDPHWAVCNDHQNGESLTCSAFYDTPEVIAKSWQVVPQSEVCVEKMHNILLKILGDEWADVIQIPEIKKNTFGILGEVTLLYLSSDLFSRELYLAGSKAVGFKTPLHIPIKLANLLSFPMYREVLGMVDYVSLILKRSFFGNEKLFESPIEIRFKKGNLMGFLCQALQMAESSPETKTRLQCQVIAVLTAFTSCFFSQPFQAVSRNVTLMDKKEASLLGLLSKKTCTHPNPFATTQINKNDLEMEFIGIHMKDYNVSSENPLPAEIPIEHINGEGICHYFLLSACFTCLSPDKLQVPYGSPSVVPLPDLIPGWKMELIVYIREEGSLTIHVNQSHVSTDRIPFLFVSRFMGTNSPYNSPCDILVISRGTVTGFEWRNDFLSNTISFLAYGPPDAKAHFGFVSIARAVESPLASYITSLLSKCPRVTAYLTGHSLGGAVSQVLALLLRDRFTSAELKIHAAAFASPMVFNKPAAEYYGKQINSRNFRFARDTVVMFPCDDQNTPNGHPRCTYSKTFSTAVETGFGSDIYHVSPGVVEIPVPPDGESYIQISPDGTITLANNVFVNHDKAYKTFFSNYCDG